jgi:hypothetical protein
MGGRERVFTERQRGPMIFAGQHGNTAMGNSLGRFVWVRKSIASIGLTLLYLVLALPSMALFDVAYRPWRSYTDVYLPLLTPHVGEDWALMITVGPLLAIMLAMWAGTVKLVERLFRFRFP